MNRSPNSAVQRTRKFPRKSRHLELTIEEVSGGQSKWARKVKQHSEEFKATAVKLSSLAGVLTQDVARELDIHPFMVSRWRKEVRKGKLVATTKEIELEPQAVAELQRLKDVEREYT